MRTRAYYLREQTPASADLVARIVWGMVRQGYEGGRIPPPLLGPEAAFEV